jgi:hypothetical protein
MALQTIDPSQAVISSVGSAISGGTTSTTKPVIKGTADAGNIVVIYDGIRVVGSALVAANGTWSFTPTVDLKSGSHSFAAIATDANGNHGASSAVVNVTVAATVVAPVAPVITGLVDAVGAITGSITNGMTTDDTRPTMNGKGVAGDTIKLYDGSTLIGSTVVKTDGTWSVQPTAALSNGAHDLYATETNTAGTSGHSTDISFKVDTSTPATPATSVISNDSGTPIVAGGTTNDAHPDISGKGTAGDTITVYDNGKAIGSLIIPDSGNWSFTPSPDLPSGDNVITVIETNPAGTSSGTSAPITVVVDTSKPATPAAPDMTDANGDTIYSGDVITDTHPTLSGTGTAGHTITVYDGATVIGSTTIKSDGTWSFKPATDLSKGKHTITVVDTNQAGTSSAHSDADIITITTATASAPVITNVADATTAHTGTVAAGGTTADSHPTISGTGTAGDTIYIYQNSALCGSTTVDSSGKWSLKLTGALTEGSHTMTATQFASGQSESALSNAWTIKVDTSTPATPAAPTMTDDNGAAIAAGSTTADAHRRSHVYRPSDETSIRPYRHIVCVVCVHGMGYRGECNQLPGQKLHIEQPANHAI